MNGRGCRIVTFNRVTWLEHGYVDSYVDGYVTVSYDVTGVVYTVQHSQRGIGISISR